MKMRKTLIIAAALAAMACPAMAGTKTFDEMFPATPSISEWCSALPGHSIYRTNACIESAQMDYEEDMILWSALSQERQEACSERWATLKMSVRARYIAIHACLTNELTAQGHDREEHQFPDLRMIQ
jgi:hypothetical protein